VAAAAASLDKEAVLISNPDDHQIGVYAASWILVGRRSGFLGQSRIEKAGTILSPVKNAPFWTDDYSSLLAILK
jgi:hypothetical protein